MLPGPFYVYKCSNCGKLVKTESYLSTNTFGARYYSDGKVIAQMKPEINRITVCKNCDTIFWLRKENQSGIIMWEDRLNEKWSEIEIAEFLSIYQYQNALEKRNYQSRSDRIYLRQQIWWSFNDRVRNSEPQFTSDEEKVIWEKNIKRLIKLFNRKDINQRIMIAELYRNQGKFKKCMKKLNSIKNTNYNSIKEAFHRECEKENKDLFLLV